MLDLNAERAQFAHDLAADPLRNGLDKAFAAALSRTYRQGLRDAALPGTRLWQPCEAIPEPGTTAIIATLSDDLEFWSLCEGVYHHIGGEWREERSGLTLDCAEFWWLAEADLTRGLPDIQESAA